MYRIVNAFVHPHARPPQARRANENCGCLLLVHIVANAHATNRCHRRRQSLLGHSGRSQWSIALQPLPGFDLSLAEEPTAADRASKSIQ
jgi:hypothetical protein